MTAWTDPAYILEEVPDQLRREGHDLTDEQVAAVLAMVCAAGWRVVTVDAYYPPGTDLTEENLKLVVNTEWSP